MDAVSTGRSDRGLSGGAEQHAGSGVIPFHAWATLKPKRSHGLRGAAKAAAGGNASPLCVG